MDWVEVEIFSYSGDSLPAFVCYPNSMNSEFIRKFAEACVIPIIFYCSPAIFAGLPKQGFALLRRSIKLISNVFSLSFSYLTNLVCERHIKASSDFAARILADNQHATMQTCYSVQFDMLFCGFPGESSG